MRLAGFRPVLSFFELSMAFGVLLDFASKVGWFFSAALRAFFAWYAIF